MSVDPADYLIRGVKKVVRPQATGGGGCIVKIYHCEIRAGGDSFFYIPVAAGETLLIWSWWLVPINSDLEMAIYVDGLAPGDRVEPMPQAINASFASHWPGAFSTSISGLSAGTHAIGLGDFNAVGEGAGMVIMRVLDTCFESMINLGT